MPNSASDPVYFTDAAGVRYRVFDAAMSDGKTVVANPPAPWAKFRIFRPAEGHRRLYYFQPGETRAPDGAELERQLRVAAYLPIDPPHEAPLDPR